MKMESGKLFLILYQTTKPASCSNSKCKNEKLQVMKTEKVEKLPDKRGLKPQPGVAKTADGAIARLLQLFVGV